MDSALQIVAAGGDLVLEVDATGEWICDGPRGTAVGALSAVVVACAAAPEPGWVNAVVAAIEREVAECGRLVRIGLIVRRGVPEDRYVHVSRSANRTSIQAHGLDWRRMTAVAGIAGSSVPERAAIFLDSEGVDSFFRSAAFTHDPTDVWAVDVDGLWLESAPDSSGGLDDGWVLHASPIPVDRLTLLDAGEARASTGT